MSNPFDKNQKKFSVITPIYKKTYNTLPKFFQALNEQDYSNFEVIVVFDGPNSSGKRKLNQMIKKYPNIKVKSKTQEWGGAPKARNTGAEMSTGDFLTFLDPDVYIYPDTLRFWASAFEKSPNKDVIWGLYEILAEGKNLQVGGLVPVDANDKPLYWAFRYSNYCSGAFPIRKEAFVGWGEDVKSLQDWDMWVRMLKKDNFEGKKFEFHRKSFFVTEAPRKGGLSDDSSKNWIDRVNYVKEKSQIPKSDTCVCSLGAQYHGVNIAKMLGYDYLPIPSQKPNQYKRIILLGFYSSALEEHLSIFNTDHKTKKIIHWIGTDIYQLGHSISVHTWKELVTLFKREKFVHLSEADFTQKELKDLNIKSKVVPIPPAKIYKLMPLPDKFTVGIYENPTQKMYSEELMEHIARSMPDIDFKFFGNPSNKGRHDNVEHLGWIDFDIWMKEFSCNLRITTHDGLSITALQFLTAGRSVVTNTPVKGAIVCESNRKDIVSAIRKAQKEGLNLKWSKYWRKTLDKTKYKNIMDKI